MSCQSSLQDTTRCNVQSRCASKTQAAERTVTLGCRTSNLGAMGMGRTNLL